MRTVSGTSLVLAAMLAVLPAHPARAQIGGLIKRKAAEAVKGKDDKAAKTVGKDEGPITSQFAKECGPVTPEGIASFLKGLQLEVDGRAAFDRKLGGTTPDQEVVACQQRETTTPAALAILQRGLENGGSVEYVQKQAEKNREELEKYLIRKCGVKRSTVEPDQWKEYGAAHKAAGAAAGVSEECYDKLKEFVLAFCKGLTPAQQKIATEQGIKVPGSGEAMWVFAPDEARALYPRCGELVKAVNATGYGVEK